MIVHESIGYLVNGFTTFSGVSDACLSGRDIPLPPALRVRTTANPVTVALQIWYRFVQGYHVNALRRIYKIIAIVRPPCSAAMLWLSH